MFGKILLLALIWYLVCVYGNVENVTCSDPSVGPVLNGIDVVSVFLNQKLFGQPIPEKGVSLYNAKIGDFEFYFKNQTNLDLFLSNTSYYLPQFGGYDTWGASGLDPTCTEYICLSRVCENNKDGYEIYKNKLYLFWGDGGKNAFDIEPDLLIRSGDKTWAQFLTNNNYSYCYNTQLFKPCT
eukprot:254895_1